MKRKLILKYIQKDYSEESNRFTNEYSEVYTIFIPFKETGLNKKLLKEVEKRDQLVEKQTKINDFLINIEDKDYTVYDYTTYERLGIEKTKIDLNMELFKGKLSDIQIKNANFFELNKKELTIDKEINPDLFNVNNDWDLYELLRDAETYRKNYTTKIKNYEIEIAGYFERLKDKKDKKLEEYNNNKNKLNKIEMEIIRLEELIKKNDKKTDEDLYIELKNSGLKIIDDKEISDDGKFYAKREGFNIIESGKKITSEQSFEEWNNFDDFIEFMNLSRNRIVDEERKDRILRLNNITNNSQNIISDIINEDKRRQKIDNRINKLKNQYVNEMKIKRKSFIKIIENLKKKKNIIDRTINFFNENTKEIINQKNKLKEKFFNFFGSSKKEEPIKEEPIKEKTVEEKTVDKKNKLKEKFSKLFGSLKKEPVKEEPIKEEPKKEEQIKEKPKKEKTKEEIKKEILKKKKQLQKKKKPNRNQGR